MGQYNPEVLSGAGRGDGGRNVVQKYELLLRISNVSTSVVVNNVAKWSDLNTDAEGGRLVRHTQVRAPIGRSLDNLGRLSQHNKV
jgi:hypothetical protein